jgi:hypothetical protein
MYKRRLGRDQLDRSASITASVQPTRILGPWGFLVRYIFDGSFQRVGVGAQAIVGVGSSHPMADSTPSAPNGVTDAKAKDEAQNRNGATLQNGTGASSRAGPS